MTTAAHGVEAWLDGLFAIVMGRAAGGSDLPPPLHSHTCSMIATLAVR